MKGSLMTLKLFHRMYHFYNDMYIFLGRYEELVSEAMPGKIMEKFLFYNDRYIFLGRFEELYI